MPGFLQGPVTGFTDRAKGKGLVSSSWLNQIGNSAAQATGGGVVATTSVVGINPSSTNNDNVLVVWQIPANLFSKAGITLEIQANGSVANNTNSKRLKIWAGATTAVVGSAVTGGTLIADSGAYTTAGAVGWQIGAFITKYGAAGSNTQIAVHAPSIIGTTTSSLVVPTALTLTENASFLLVITGNAVTTATDITLVFAQLFATN
jgi:hypothetical protein